MMVSKILGPQKVFVHGLMVLAEPCTFPSFESLDAYKNLGKNCWGACGRKDGFCSWCGTEGLCCRKGWTGNGCDGKMGGNGHACVKRQGKEREEGMGVKLCKTSVQAGILVYISKPLIALLFKHFRSRGRVSLRKHRARCDDPSLRAHPPCEMQPGGGNSGHSNEVGGRRSVTVRH